MSAGEPAVGRIKDSIMQKVLRRMGPGAELIGREADTMGVQIDHPCS